MATTYYIGDEELDVTYNYAWIFYKLHKKGLQAISGKTGKQALKILLKFEKELTTGAFGCANKDSKKNHSYWTCSPNNCYHNAVKPLIAMAERNKRKKFLAH